MDGDERRDTPHPPAGPEDSSGNRPEEQRPPKDTPLEDEKGRSEHGHPHGTENFRGGGS